MQRVLLIFVPNIKDTYNSSIYRNKNRMHIGKIMTHVVGSFKGIQLDKPCLLEILGQLDILVRVGF